LRYDDYGNCYIIETREDLIEILRSYKIINIEEYKKDVLKLNMVSFNNDPKCQIIAYSHFNPCELYKIKKCPQCGLAMSDKEYNDYINADCPDCESAHKLIKETLTITNSNTDIPSDITFFIDNYTKEILRIDPEGFWIRGIKVEQGPDEAKIVYQAFLDFLKGSHLYG